MWLAKPYLHPLALVRTLILIPLVLFATGTWLSGPRAARRKDQWTPFECGFESFFKARGLVSLKFFSVVIVFLVFDVEVALVLFTPLVTPRLGRGVGALV